MASTADPIYLPESPRGQALTFDIQSCDEFNQVIGNASGCNEAITNPTFAGAWENHWTINIGIKAGEDPALLNDDGTTTPSVQQTITDVADGQYVVKYKFSYDGAGTMSCNLAITSGYGSATLFPATTDDTVTGNKVITINGGSTTRTFALNFSLGGTGNVTLHYVYLCRLDKTIKQFVPESDFCFQVPLFDTGTEVIGLTNEVIDFTVDESINAGYDSNEDTTGAACPGAPAAADFAFTAACQTAGILNGDGEYFIEIKLGAVDIDFALNPDDNTSGEVHLVSIDGAEESDYTISDKDANTDIFYLSTNGWNSGDQPELKVRAIEECDTSTNNLRTKWDITVDEYSWYPSFHEESVTLADDTFYRIVFKLNKTTSATFYVIDSTSTTIFETSTSGVELDKIFKTGTLPGGGAVTLRWEIADMIEYPNVNFNDSVLTEVQLWQMCSWSADVIDSDEVSALTPTETHATVSEATGSSYNVNQEFCFDVNALPPGCYQVNLIDQCDTDKFYYSNKLLVCTNDKNLKEISWAPSNIIYSGAEVLDYTAYNNTQYVWVRAELQDLVMEIENEFYRRTSGYWSKPWEYQSQVQVLQIWPVPPYLRQALALAMSGTFKINGIEYQKLSDDEYGVEFNAVHESPMRILVKQVGRFIINRQ